MQPHQFLDSEGDQWSVSVNIRLYKRFQDEYGIDLLDMSEEGFFVRVAERSNIINLCLILYDCCEKQVRDRDMSDEEFFERLTGDVLDSAANALLEAVVNFMPGHQRAVVRQQMEKLQAGKQKMEELVIARMKDQELMSDEKMEKLLNEAIQKAFGE